MARDKPRDRTRGYQIDELDPDMIRRLDELLDSAPDLDVITALLLACDGPRLDELLDEADETL